MYMYVYVQTRNKERKQITGKPILFFSSLCLHSFPFKNGSQWYIVAFISHLFNSCVICIIKYSVEKM